MDSSGTSSVQRRLDKTAEGALDQDVAQVEEIEDAGTIDRDRWVRGHGFE